MNGLDFVLRNKDCVYNEKILTRFHEDTDKIKEVQSIFLNEHPDYFKKWKSIERSTFIFLVIGFIWVIVGPIVLP